MHNNNFHNKVNKWKLFYKTQEELSRITSHFRHISVYTTLTLNYDSSLTQMSKLKKTEKIVNILKHIRAYQALTK